MSRVYYLKNQYHRHICPRVEFVCKRCGKILMLSPGRAKVRKFCSKACDRDRGTVDERIAFCSEPQPNGCINWTGYKSDGYGKLSIGGKLFRVIRLIWEKHHGPIPEKQIIRHKCDNPGCVNIEHLEIGTTADNARDRASRGRNGDHKGINNGRAKVTWEMVNEMRKLRPKNSGRNHPVPYHWIAKNYGLSLSQAVNIIQEYGWKQIDNSPPP